MKTSKAACLFTLITTAWITLLLVLKRTHWLPWVARALIVQDPLQPADAIVALNGGGRGRIQAAAALFQRGYARWFITTDMPFEMPGVQESYRQLVVKEALQSGVSPDRILSAPGCVETTAQEAQAVRTLVQKRGFKSLIVVTDPAHSRRARLIFRKVFANMDCQICVQPVPGHHYDPNRWWLSVSGLQTTSNEYLKFIPFFLGHR